MNINTAKKIMDMRLMEASNLIASIEDYCKNPKGTIPKELLTRSGWVKYDDEPPQYTLHFMRNFMQIWIVGELCLLSKPKSAKLKIHDIIQGKDIEIKYNNKKLLTFANEVFEY